MKKRSVRGRPKAGVSKAKVPTKRSQRRSISSKHISKTLAFASKANMRALIAVAAAIILVIAGWWGVSASNRSAQWKHDHKWQSTVEKAEDYFGVDRSFTDCMLTILQVESSGNEDVDKRHDIAQAWEGDGSKYMKKGVKSEGVEPYTVEASIYAGTCELSLCVRDFKEYLGYNPDPTDLNDLALLAQGYNYGHLGWFSWLKAEGITEWSLEISERYQERIGGLGTAIHGQKIMDTYIRVTEGE